MGNGPSRPKGSPSVPLVPRRAGAGGQDRLPSSSYGAGASTYRLRTPAELPKDRGSYARGVLVEFSIYVDAGPASYNQEHAKKLLKLALVLKAFEVGFDSFDLAYDDAKDDKKHIYGNFNMTFNLLGDDISSMLSDMKGEVKILIEEAKEAAKLCLQLTTAEDIKHKLEAFKTRDPELFYTMLISLIYDEQLSYEQAYHLDQGLVIARILDSAAAGSVASFDGVEASRPGK